MINPYQGKPDHQFWRRAVAAPPPTDVDPVVTTRFRIGRLDKIATAGSCFAQHIARTLANTGYAYMVAESEPAFDFVEPENFGVFSARYGNIYTVRQLLQLFRRAYDLFEPTDDIWRREDGRFIDAFRPRIQSNGFETLEQARLDRVSHLAAVRTMFEECDVFIFTLGLTEAWVSPIDGAALPLPPGTVGSVEGHAEFHNFTAAEMQADLTAFLDVLKGINPTVRVMLTVSPVPLIATYEDRHVLVAASYSKSALRVVAEQAIRDHDWVDYFPSYEMITGAHTRGAFFSDDLREIRPEGVAYVMNAFSRHYLSDADSERPSNEGATPYTETVNRQAVILDHIGEVVCDEDAIEVGL